MERSLLCVRKQRVVHDLTCLWGKVLSKKVLQSLQSRKRCCRSWLFEENKDRHNLDCENIQTVGQILMPKDTQLSLVSPASLKKSLHRPDLSSPGCDLDTNFYIIILSLNVHHFKSNVKQKLISQPFILPHFILQTSKSPFRLSPHDKLHTPENWFFQRSSLTLYVSTWPKSMILITALHTWPTAC